MTLLPQPQRRATLQVGLRFTDLHGNMKHMTVQPDRASKSRLSPASVYAEICYKTDSPWSFDELVSHFLSNAISVAISGQQRSATPTLACGCDAHESIPVLLASCSQSFEVSQAWVLDSTWRPCLSDRMLAIIYVLGERGCFPRAVLVSIPGLLHALLLDDFLLGAFCSDSCTHPSY